MVADLNKDGFVDIAAANPTSASVSLLLGNGSGGFVNAGSVQLPGTPLSLATADFDGDGKPDLAVGTSGTLTLYSGDGALGFSHTSETAFTLSPVSLTACDINHDGFADIVARVDIPNGFSGQSSVNVLLGDASGKLVPSFELAVFYWLEPAVADFNADGNLDFAILDFSHNVTVYLGDGKGGFTAGPVSTFVYDGDPSFFSLIHGFGVGDFNGDGLPDVCAVWYLVNVFFDYGWRGETTALLNDGTGRFVNPQALQEFTASTLIPRATAVASQPEQSDWIADLDGDGRADVGWFDYDSRSVQRVDLSDGSGSFPEPLYFYGETLGSVLADVNGDGKPDLIRGGTNGLSISLNTMQCFAQPGCGDTYNVTVESDPVDAGAVSGGGQFHYGSAVTLTAVPKRGWVFLNWSFDFYHTSRANPYNYPARHDMNFIARFIPDTGPQLPDLVATWQSVKKLRRHHGRAIVHAKLQVTNSGSAMAPPFHVRCRLSSDDQLSTDDAIIAEWQVPAIATDVSQQKKVKAIVRDYVAGNNPTLFAEVDTDETATESNESNNVTSYPLP